MTCGDRRGHAGGAGADHQRIAFIRGIHAIVLNVCHAASLFFQKRAFGFRIPMARSPEPLLVSNDHLHSSADRIPRDHVAIE